MKHLRWAWLIACKDLRVELRSGGRLVVMIAFAVLAAFLFAFSLDRSLTSGREVAAPLTWLAVVFATTLGAARAFDMEEEDGAFRHLLITPVSRPAVFLGKAGASWILAVLVTGLCYFATTAFLGLRSGGSPLLHALVFLPGTIGLAAVGTLFGRVTSRSSLGDALLPVLTFPLLVPLVFFGTTATARVFLDRPWPELAGPVRLMWAFAIGSVAVGALLFRHVADE